MILDAFAPFCNHVRLALHAERSEKSPNRCTGVKRINVDSYPVVFDWQGAQVETTAV